MVVVLVSAMLMTSGCATRFKKAYVETRYVLEGFESEPMPITTDSEKYPNGKTARSRITYGSTSHTERNKRARAALGR